MKLRFLDEGGSIPACAGEPDGIAGVVRLE